MSQIEAANALATLISIGIFLGWYYWFYQEYRVDDLRQKLFTIRERLFDYADEGHVEFTNPAYKVLREMLNLRIRYAERFGLWNIIIFGFFMSERIKVLMEINGEYDQEELQKHMEKLSDSQRRFFSACIEQMNRKVVTYTFLSSLLMVIFVVTPCIVLMAISKKIKPYLTRFLHSKTGMWQIQKIDEMALGSSFIDEDLNDRHRLA